MTDEAGESDVTRLLQAWRDGNRAAFEDLIPLGVLTERPS